MPADCQDQNTTQRQAEGDDPEHGTKEAAFNLMNGLARDIRVLMSWTAF